MSEETTKIKKPFRLNKTRFYGVLGLLVAIIILLSVNSFRNKSELRGCHVTIKPLASGNSMITEKDILKVLNNSFEGGLEHLPIYAVETDRVENVLESDPFIQNAEAYIDAQNQLGVKIEQREPIVRVIDNNGLNYYIDAKGAKLPPSKHYSPRVPIATGSLPAYIPNFQEKKKYLLKDLFILVQTLQKDDFFDAMIQQIYVNPNGEFTLIPTVGEQQLLIGTIDDLEEKLERLRVFYKEGMPYQGWQKYSTINVMYKGQVICKKR